MLRVVYHQAKIAMGPSLPSRLGCQGRLVAIKTSLAEAAMKPTSGPLGVDSLLLVYSGTAGRCFWALSPTGCSAILKGLQESSKLMLNRHLASVQGLQLMRVCLRAPRRMRKSIAFFFAKKSGELLEELRDQSGSFTGYRYALQSNVSCIMENIYLPRGAP